MHSSKLFFVITSIFILLSACTKEKGDDDTTPILDDGFIRGVDISFLPMIEKRNITLFNKDYEAKNGLRIMKESGVNTVRIRLWHRPSNEHSGLEEVVAFANRVKSEGMKVWLCLHYSDTWADPGEQEAPQLWQNLTYPEVRDSLIQYTINVMEKVDPDIVQIGNEINNGMVYPYGSRWNQEAQFKDLVKEGIKAAKEVNPDCKIMLHYAGTNRIKDFLDLFDDLDYDQIGISYYPLWHGKDLTALESTLKSIGTDYDKEVIIAETAYPFTLSWNDFTNNIMGEESQLILPDYPATLKGQRDFLDKIVEITQRAEGHGVCYWGAAWISFDGPESTNGSSWENQALFDFSNRIVPAASVFKER